MTHEYVSQLDGSIDIWDTGPPGFRLDTVARERAKGKKYWFYNGTRPQSGTMLIDAPATDGRELAWAAFKHDVDVYFFWHAVHWRHNTQKQGERNQNVWANPITFDDRGQPHKPLIDQGYINGDGVLMYPGEEKLHPEEDRGVPGPVSTIQLANLRRGPAGPPVSDDRPCPWTRRRGEGGAGGNRAEGLFRRRRSGQLS